MTSGRNLEVLPMTMLKRLERRLDVTSLAHVGVVGSTNVVVVLTECLRFAATEDWYQNAI